MQGDEARALLGLSSTSHLTPSQVKAAYKRKAWESHPDRFPANEKFSAETKFKLISEAYSCLKLGIGQGGTNSGLRNGRRRQPHLTILSFHDGMLDFFMFIACICLN
ncbi:dnaJ homolog subfamily B member 5-like isoform X3 [Papaver somniferum]|uniref:dnaJ homolog subfamily B member 5-like isoform X3 n=1 Tax=Papaver somniferum TaxID=3469 RepID=UPI000E6F5F50|nr:dnaJ homolog subfamily B member 5-like isoform X3 [Papaver somniferum]